MTSRYEKHVQHFSTRIPWKDNGFTGKIDNNPKYNISAQIIPTIATSRNIEFEEYNKGKDYCAIETESVLKWIEENAAFMSTSSISYYNDLLSPYSFLLRPNSWRLSNYEFNGIKEEFDQFFSGIVSNQSIILPYFNQVPFTEDNRKVIAGIGNLILENYKYVNLGVNVSHTIRDNGDSGFIMPYLELMEYANEHPNFQIDSVILFEPVCYRKEFTNSTEWARYDAVIEILNQAKRVMNIIAGLELKVANSEWALSQIIYIDKQLEQLWSHRGKFPGLRSMLSILGVKNGFDIAKIIEQSKLELTTGFSEFFTREKKSDVIQLDNSMDDSEYMINLLLNDKHMMGYFEILSRMNLTMEQTLFLWNEFKENSIEILENPYMLYELSRNNSEDLRISISQLDNALNIVSNDRRRIRAYIFDILIRSSEKGHTLLIFSQILQELQNLDVNFSVEELNEIASFLQAGKLYVDEENQYVKLEEYQYYKEIIVEITNRRLQSQIKCSQNWMDIINDRFGELQINNEENDLLARREKANALIVMESSEISVLVGRAGTGKTSALGVLAASKEVSDGGILALSPTGKARVQLEKSFKKGGVDGEFMTIAQFLQNSNGYNEETGTYVLPDAPSSSCAETIIIDECSMLTEEMFVGILKLVDSHAKRIIFVGDPNQLPPVGAGRPFVDLIQYLTSSYPRNISILEIEMRQGKGGDDLNLAHLFSDKKTIHSDIIKRINYKQTDERLEFIQYDHKVELEEMLISQIMQIAEMEYEDDIYHFNKSLGATIEETTNYHTSKHIEDWQILTPTKYVGVGSYYLNEFIHRKYRQSIMEEWKSDYSITKPQSLQQIVFGDKVISNVNDKRTFWDGTPGELYLANGEIGIMSGYPEQDELNDNWYLFRFGSFESKEFSFVEQDFGEEDGESKLDLAYALTVQRIQGTGFFKSIVVLEKNNSAITKELLYTAFSRQKQRLIVLSNFSTDELHEYSSDWYSDTKQRCTDLFEKPNLVEVELNGCVKLLEGKLLQTVEQVS